MWVDLESPDPGVIAKATQVIRSGGVVLYPSDTIYGLGCDPFDEKAVKKIYDLKGRDVHKGVLLLVPDGGWVSRLAAGTSPAAEYLMCHYWPGPLTLLFHPGSSVPSNIVGKEGLIGIRYPQSRFLQAWMNSLGGPLVSTSANLSGTSSSQDPETLRKLFRDQVDLFLEAGELAAKAPSTVVDASGVPKIVRRGARSEEIEEALARWEEQ